MRPSSIRMARLARTTLLAGMLVVSSHAEAAGSGMPWEEPLQKVLKSAVANALHVGKVRLEDLYVKEAVVGAGPTLKRWLPRAQGRATPILKRMSHVSVTVATRE